MKNFFSTCALALLAISSVRVALAVDVPSVPPPVVNAKAYLLIDFDSNRVLAEANADLRMEPASLTKMLTAYIVDAEVKSGKIKHTDLVTINETAWRMGGSRMFAKVGSQVSVINLLKGVIIQSGNDATVALAEHIGGSEEAFTALMNQYAHQLGMMNSHFTNSTGLPDAQHYTTPRDLATLASALIRDFPESYSWYSIKQYTYNNITQYNRNRLLWSDLGVDGLKTGHTDSAGYCLVASAKKGGMRLISVVLGTTSDNARAEESEKLLAWGYRGFETHRLYMGAELLTETPIWKGDKEKLSLGLISDLYITIPRGQYDQLTATIDLNTRITAPAQKGQQYGTVKVTLGDQTFAEHGLIALESVAPGSMVNNAVDDFKLWWRKVRTE